MEAAVIILAAIALVLGIIINAEPQAGWRSPAGWGLIVLAVIHFLPWIARLAD